MIDAALMNAAIIESVVLPVRPGMEAEFETAFATAEPLIARARGYRGHSLRSGVELPGTYLLTVGWDSVDAHEGVFRGSEDYARWRELVHRFCEPMPTVLHYGEDLAGRRKVGATVHCGEGALQIGRSPLMPSDLGPARVAWCDGSWSLTALGARDCARGACRDGLRGAVATRCEHAR